MFFNVFECMHIFGFFFFAEIIEQWWSIFLIRTDPLKNKNPRHYSIHSIFSGQVYLTPAALAELWKEEQDNAKALEEKFRTMVRARGVSNELTKGEAYTFHYRWTNSKIIVFKTTIYMFQIVHKQEVNRYSRDFTIQ